MSESILKAIIKLFAIIAGLEEQSEGSRHVVFSFLNQQLNLERTFFKTRLVNFRFNSLLILKESAFFSCKTFSHKSDNSNTQILH